MFCFVITAHIFSDLLKCTLCGLRLCVTKLDILDVLPELKIAVGYKKNGKLIDYFPSSAAELATVEVKDLK